MKNEVYHIPALLNETIEGLDIKPSGIYVDVTFGGGGHSRAILEANAGRLFSFDQDADALANAIDDERWTFVHSNFRYLRNWLDFYGVTAIDGLLADLGVSFHHFDCPERGFSFRFSAPLDMRMNQTAKRTAADIVNTYSEEDLAQLFYLYGELKNGRQIAKAICSARTKNPILRTEDLVAASRQPDGQKLAQYVEAAGLTKDSKTLVSIVNKFAAIPTPESFDAIVPYLDNADKSIAYAAANAAAGVAQKCAAQIDKARIRTALTKASAILAATGDADDGYAVDAIRQFLSTL